VGKHAVEVLEWLPFQSGTLLGFAKIRIKELRLVIRGVAIHQKNSSRWAQLLSMAMVQDDQLVRGPDGRIRYAKILEFETAEIRQAFRAAVLDAYDSYRPP
jgi:hypothetical protein